MTRIRIWNYEEVAKNTRPNYMTVPDSAIRPGESEAEWLLRMLLRDLQALAAESRIQIAAHTNFVPVADELANSLEEHVRHAPLCVEQGLISQGD